MKLRNLIFALFLAIGAIGFTACTGDDGAQGPKGDQGEQGEKGEAGESAEGSDVDSREFFYPFLATWGAGEDGGAACDDPIIDGDGVFPGPDLVAFTMTEADLDANDAAGVTCATGFVETNHDPDGDGPLDNVLDANVDGLVLVKTGRATAPPETVDNIPETLDNPTRTVTTVTKVGGGIYAELDDTGGDSEEQSFYRGRLHNTCGGPTTPPSLAGEWIGLQKIETTHDRTGSAAAGFENDDDSMVQTTTTKVCLKLDAHPGSVKCFVRVVKTSPDGPDADTDRDSETTETIGLYNADGTLTPVAPMANSDGIIAVTGSTNLETVFGTGNGIMVVQEKLCNLLPF